MVVICLYAVAEAYAKAQGKTMAELKDSIEELKERLEGSVLECDCEPYVEFDEGYWVRERAIREAREAREVVSPLVVVQWRK